MDPIFVCCEFVIDIGSLASTHILDFLIKKEIDRLVSLLEVSFQIHVFIDEGTES